MNGQATKHKIGDVVILKSGGPPMTVHGFGDYPGLDLHPGVLCVWFNSNERVESVFHPDSIERYEIGV